MGSGYWKHGQRDWETRPVFRDVRVWQMYSLALKRHCWLTSMREKNMDSYEGRDNLHQREEDTSIQSY